MTLTQMNIFDEEFSVGCSSEINVSYCCDPAFASLSASSLPWIPLCPGTWVCVLCWGGREGGREGMKKGGREGGREAVVSFDS